MSKLLIVIILIAVLIVVVLGIFYILGMFKNPNNFEIQGMKVEILTKGTGDGVKSGDYVTVHYIGTLEDGKQFDSSVERNAPFSFTIGKGYVIKGWDLGVAGMKVGEKRKLVVPPELAYGANGFPPIIPQNATLTFEVMLLKIN